jgi:SAM-dependent methyltransferase
MKDGERQVAPTRAGIRRDHVARYEWAAQQLGAALAVVDVACGVGYGSQLLAEAGHDVVGIDADAEAIEYGRQHYAHPRLQLQRGDANELGLQVEFGAAVCFETIEHVADPLPLLKALHKSAPILLASVPNESVFPHGGRIAFHFRHYTRAQFQELLELAGYQVTAWYGQAGAESEVEPGIEGRTLIAVARRAHVRVEPIPAVTPAPRASLKVAAPDNVPEHVAIVGLGPSCREFFELTRRLGGVSGYCDEVWGLNAIGDVLRCARIFHMDDVRIQELRAVERPDSNIAVMVQWLKKHPGPVYTSVVREGYPGLVAFPLQDVLNGRYDTNGGAPYFNSTAAYAIAYAVHLGVKRISLFGLDYTLPNAHEAEKGRACCEFWLGIATARGIEISVSEHTSMLDACEPEEMRLYGYDCVDVTLRDRAEGGVEVLFQEKSSIPTAEEIERRYDHKQHPSPLMKK